MEEKYIPQTVDSKFMSNMKKKINTKQKDDVKIEQQSMVDILQNIVEIPGKLHMVGVPEKPSAKLIKNGENPMLTGKGKDKFKSTM